MKVLLVEDERPLAMAATKILSRAGFDVTWASDGVMGYESAKEGAFDVIVLDVLIPRRNGWQVLEDLRAEKINVPILMLSALDEARERVRGLNLGADDYLAKPFEAEELVARVNALVRRDRAFREHLIQVADLTIDRKARTAIRAGRPLRLTRREYDLLVALAANEGRVLSRETIQERVWSMDEAFSNAVDVFVVTLRRKVDAPFGTKLIHTELGMGYVLRAPESNPLRSQGGFASAT